MNEQLDIVYEPNKSKKIGGLFGRCYKNLDFLSFFKHELERLKKEKPNNSDFENEYIARSTYKIYKARTELICEPFGGQIPNEYDYVFAVLRLRLPDISDENIKKLTLQEIHNHYHPVTYNVSLTGVFNQYTVNIGD